MTAVNVHLLVPCLVRDLFPNIARAARVLLERAGCTVHVPPGQTCCGQPLYKAGHFAKAARLAQRYVEMFLAPGPDGEEPDYVVAPSGSCVNQLRKAYPELLAGDAALRQKAKDLASRTFELSEFLVRVAGVDSAAKLGSPPFPHKVAFHDSCQVARALGVRQEPRTLLTSVLGLELVELAATHPDHSTTDGSIACCGFGGPFSVQFAHISGALAEAKVEQILCSGARVLTSAEPSCLMQLRGALDKAGSGMQVLHFAEILAGPGSSTLQG